MSNGVHQVAPIKLFQMQMLTWTVDQHYQVFTGYAGEQIYTSIL